MEMNSTPDTIEQQARQAADAVLRGGVIVYPTDTIWGIGCDATNPQAVERVFALKKRAESKSLIVLVGSEDGLLRTVRHVPDPAWDILRYSQRPVTIIYDHPVGVASNVLAEDGSLGIRVTSDPFCRRLIELIRRPLVSTSANISGEPSPQCFDEISPEILARADYTVDYRRNDHRKAQASSVIKLTDDCRVTILRK